MKTDVIAKEANKIQRFAHTARNSLVSIPGAWFVMLIVALAMVTGIIGISLNNPLQIAPDGTGYYNYAVNIKNSGIYSFFIDPVEDNYFREPGYPYFLAAVMTIWHGKSQAEYIKEYDSDSKLIKEYRADMMFIRYCQLGLMIFAIIVFYNYLMLISTRFLARLSSILCSIYYPLIVYVTQILREPLLLLLFTLFVYTLTVYFKKDKKYMLALAAVFSALITLTFQVMVVFIPISMFLILIAPSNRKISSKIKDLLLFIIIAILSLLPWVGRVYRYYPDVRVAKTVGCALTHESSKYIGSVRAAEKRGIISKEELSQIEHNDWYQLGSKDIFERSFNGWYLDQAEEWRGKKPHAQPQKWRRLKKYISYYNLNWIRHSWPPLNFKERDGYSVFLLIPFLLSAFIGVISTIGIIVYLLKERLFYVSPYLFFTFGVIYRFGSERRRSLPIMPMILFLFIYIAVIVCNYIIENRSKIRRVDVG